MFLATLTSTLGFLFDTKLFPLTVIRVLLDETVTTLVYEYARMADQVTSARASLIVEYIMGPELQTILEMKPVRLGRINTRVEYVANGMGAC